MYRPTLHIYNKTDILYNNTTCYYLYIECIHHVTVDICLV